MHRFRSISVSFCICFALFLLTRLPISAAPAQLTGVYLAMVFGSPPAISTTVIQPSDIAAGFVLIEAKEVNNEDAAKLYPDPAAALQAFQSQGRETSYYIRYDGSHILSGSVLTLENQSFRYHDATGAQVGQDMTMALFQQKYPTLTTFTIGAYGDRTETLQRTYSDSSNTYRDVFVTVQLGRYVTGVHLIGYSQLLTDSEIQKYVALAVGRLPAKPN